MKELLSELTRTPRDVGTLRHVKIVKVVKLIALVVL